MRLERSKEWWLVKADAEPDVPISAGIPDPSPKRLHRLSPLSLFLEARARLACLWRLGIIKRTTAFRWEMDRFLGEWSR